MLIRGKYKVFKNPSPIPMDEAAFFLLRDQDALATMTLRSYVSNILQILDWGIDPTTGEPLTDVQREDLMSRADGAHDLADEWAKKPHKLPD